MKTMALVNYVSYAGPGVERDVDNEHFAVSTLQPRII